MRNVTWVSSIKREMQNLEQVLMLGKALDNWHYQIRAYTQLPHSALGFTLHLGTSNKPSSLPFWELMILYQSSANIVPSHLSHSLVVLLSQLTMSWVLSLYLSDFQWWIRRWRICSFQQKKISIGWAYKVVYVPYLVAVLLYITRFQKLKKKSDFGGFQSPELRGEKSKFSRLIFIV
jgi:hypothetical protein